MAPAPTPNPTLSIANASTTEGGYATFNITLTGTVSSAVTFKPTLDGDQSSLGAMEYSINGTTWISAKNGVTIPKGVNSAQLRVATMDDSTDEATQSFSLSTGKITGATNSSGVTATATVLDNDDAPVIKTITNASESEGSTLVHKVTLSNASSSATSFAMNVTGDAASDLSKATFSKGVSYNAQNKQIPGIYGNYFFNQLVFFKSVLLFRLPH